MIPILLVDDNPTNLKVLSANLSGLNYQLLTATTGERALVVAENALPELILLDINLPGISGFEVCTQLKNNPKTAHIPIIFLSALDDTQSKVKGFEVGGVDYVTKPFQREEVIARVQTQLKISTLTKNLEAQNKVLETINQELTDSITYASRIQKALMPNHDVIQSYFPESFIFFQPRNIVSGDFYQVFEKRNKIFVIVADCTGHGVPGAFMSLLGMNLIGQIIEERNITETSAILDELDASIQKLVNQPLENGEIPRDGMDIAIMALDRQRNQVQYASAGRPIYFVRNGTLTDLRGDKYAIGGEKTDNKFFTHYTLTDIQPKDRFYLFSDGITDQFGGEENKKITSKRFQQWLTDTHTLPMHSQKEAVSTFFNEWKGNNEQTDDVLVTGIEIV
jgi:CheY-like chemotaxis protein/serine/threonine protein phosphatase PrpC